MDYRGAVLLILAGCLGATLVIAVGGLVWWGKPLSDVGGRVFIAVIGLIVGALSAYAIRRRNGRH